MAKDCLGQRSISFDNSSDFTFKKHLELLEDEKTVYISFEEDDKDTLLKRDPRSGAFTYTGST